uniref:Exostosin GT47 domain-containing protein n=1 Tax=viral metagenome TaxID=1070528 RepID=A0A6C0E251_9ZZZZ
MNIVTGEKIQQTCDIFLGNSYYFSYNPLILNETSKHVYLDNINTSFDNPFKVFCYGDIIDILSKKIHLFKNKFILVTHNSDVDIINKPEMMHILNCEKLLKWYGQNICFEHAKLGFLPIGLANSHWPHGNLSLFNDNSFLQKMYIKSNKVYFNFTISTNVTKRELCYNSLINKLNWINNTDPINNLKRLQTYEFCICPEGNGVDTHRLWECLYLKVVPIVIKSDFTNILLKQGIPLYVLDSWSDLDINNLNYYTYDFNNIELSYILNFSNYSNYI